MNNKTLYLVASALALGAFYLGVVMQRNKAKIQEESSKLAVKQGVQYIKSETAITKDWFNQIGNAFKQAWK